EDSHFEIEHFEGEAVCRYVHGRALYLEMGQVQTCAFNLACQP
ncbi:MAG: hypothetical protein RLZZ366_2125, partial [Pseudomonadota bacterium]